MSFQRRSVVVPFPLILAVRTLEIDASHLLAQRLVSLDAASAAGDQASAESMINDIYALMDQAAEHEAELSHRV